MSQILPPLQPDLVVAKTNAWLERVVIGLNLCPFAKAVHVKRQIRVVASPADGPDALLAELQAELLALASVGDDAHQTTLLVHPHALNDFWEFNQFLREADALLDRLGLAGVLQIASFHPDYQFADCDADDIDNHTNRSPYPTLHLLREEDIARAVQAFSDASEIYLKNIETVRRVGLAGLLALLS